MEYTLDQIIDVQQLQALQDKLNAINPFPSALIDNSGRILTATAWQDICTKFHRINPESEKECIMSDQYILSHLHEADPAVTYKCPHGMVDNAIPIIIEGHHLANFFTGEFFLEPPDLDFFRKQASRYGFGEEAYIEAVKKVPIWNMEQLHHYLDFIKTFTESLADMGLARLREIDTSSERLAEMDRDISQTRLTSVFDKMIEGFALYEIIADDSGMPVDYRFLDVNPAFEKLTGLIAQEIIGKTTGEVFPGLEHFWIERCGQVALTGEPVIDKTKLFQILNNLLSNALKFTIRGAVHFGYSKNSDSITFYIKDTGIGIPAEFKSKVFERFRKLDIHNRTDFEGTGLGLAITRELVKMLMGEIWFVSDPGQGTTFFVRFPV